MKLIVLGHFAHFAVQASKKLVQIVARKFKMAGHSVHFVVRILAKKNIKMVVSNKKSSLPKEHFANNEFAYYKEANIHTASITICNHDNSYCFEGMGIKRLVSIEKFQVDAIGNIHRVHREKRMGFVK